MKSNVKRGGSYVGSAPWQRAAVRLDNSVVLDNTRSGTRISIRNSSAMKVRGGGTWFDRAQLCRCAVRNWSSANNKHDNAGLRLRIAS